MKTAPGGKRDPAARSLRASTDGTITIGPRYSPSVLATTTEWALFFHIVGAFLFVGGAIVAAAGFEAARRRSRPDEVALLLGLTRVGVVLVALGAMLVLAFGLWLVGIGPWSLGTAWVDAALVLFAVAVVLGWVGGQRPKQARRLAVSLAREGREEDAELRALLDDRFARTANYATALVVLAIVVLMVFKPG
jgi:uncharacterized membrane protein